MNIGFKVTKASLVLRVMDVVLKQMTYATDNKFNMQQWVIQIFLGKLTYSVSAMHKCVSMTYGQGHCQNSATF